MSQNVASDRRQLRLLALPGTCPACEGPFCCLFAFHARPLSGGQLLTQALLLTGLRVRRNVALKIFRGVRLMEESDTYLMILEEGEERRVKKDILLVGEARFGKPEDSVKSQLDAATDLERLDRMMRCALRANSWKEIVDVP